jgi:hypothetical protein
MKVRGERSRECPEGVYINNRGCNRITKKRKMRIILIVTGLLVALATKGQDSLLFYLSEAAKNNYGITKV